MLTPTDLPTLFLCLPPLSAENVLGKKVDGAGLTLPCWFAPEQLDTLQGDAEATVIRVLQLLKDVGTVGFFVATCASKGAMERTETHPDHTQLTDLSTASIALSLLAICQGLFHCLTPSSYYADLGNDAINDQLLESFGKDFTRNMNMLLKVALPSEVPDMHTKARLQLALLHTQCMIVASVGGIGGSTVTCSVESLKDRPDYMGSINWLHVDMEVALVYSGIVTCAGELLQCGA